MEKHKIREYDVIVIGSGGAGLRAAVAAREAGCSVAVICKSLLGKAHTVMAEGGVAASLANVDNADNWKVHFKDTMAGGKFINNWQMARTHAQKSPEMVNELEKWGAVFDRTDSGKILQRPFGGHTYRRLCHVGDRTGLEMIRVLQEKTIQLKIDVHMECMITNLLVSGGVIKGVFGFWKNTGEFVVFKAKAVILATGGLGKIWEVTSNSWDCTGDGYALAYLSGGALQDAEFVQFHPTGMVWPLSIKGILVTEAVRGEGGLLKNNRGERFMANYDPERMELSTRDIVSKAINNEVKEGRGSEHGGVYLDISHKSARYIKTKLPSMYEQFMEFAGVDITKEAMEVGPTCHYMMGGVKVDSETQASTVEGLFAAGEAVAGLHGANRLGGNSLSDLVVFGGLVGKHAAEYSKNAVGFGDIDEAELYKYKEELTAPFGRAGGESPYKVNHDLQKVMEKNVGIIRSEASLKKAADEIGKLKMRYKDIQVSGAMGYNSGWHLAVSLKFMLELAEVITMAALERKETRGAHTREDYPQSDEEWGRKNIVVTLVDGKMNLETQPVDPVPDELK